MNKKYIIRKNEEISALIKKSKRITSRFFVIYYNENKYSYNRYCVSVSKKIGKAYVRNLYKWWIKDILMKNNFNNSCDYVIILRNAVLEVDYGTLKDELLKLLEGVK